MNHLLTPPTLIDTSAEEAKREQQIADAALRLCVESPEIVSEALFRDERIVAVMQKGIATADFSKLLELIDDVARLIVIDAKAGNQ